MFTLTPGFFLCGLLTGMVLLYQFVTSLPDGMLHLHFCNVGQGDGIYIRFPDGRDMVIDGGPDGKILQCLGEYMPFWDRSIDVAVLTHPQKDHMNGLLQVLDRYRVDTFIHSDAYETTHSSGRTVNAGQKIKIGNAVVSVLWPPKGMTSMNENDTSVVLKLSYGSFDALLPGDADSQIDESLLHTTGMDSDGIEVLKVPHHGSKTGMSDAYLKMLIPSKQAAAVISVGKNSYGHPDGGILKELQQAGFTLFRTDLYGDISVSTDGKNWSVSTSRSRSPDG